MKRYIYSSTALEQGSYLLSRDGDLIPVKYHVPSTTYVGRNLLYLSPTDASFLYSQGFIGLDELKSVLAHDFLEFQQDKDITILRISAFLNWSDSKGDSVIVSILNSMYFNRVNWGELSDGFAAVNEKWYHFCVDNYVKVSVLGKVVEFRISSEDGFDWNRVIIDEVLLKEAWRPGTKFNIVRESSKGYKAYFVNATLDDILNADKTVLSSKQYSSRRIVHGEIEYIVRE